MKGWVSENVTTILGTGHGRDFRGDEGRTVYPWDAEWRKGKGNKGVGSEGETSDTRKQSDTCRNLGQRRRVRLGRRWCECFTRRIQLSTLGK